MSLVFIPIAFFAIYIALLSLRYRKKEKYVLRTINPYSEIVINSNFVDYFFDMESNWIFVSFFNFITIIPYFYFLFVVFPKIPDLPTIIQLVLLILPSFIVGIAFILFIKKINKTSKN